jgi:hypothetical protein
VQNAYSNKFSYKFLIKLLYPRADKIIVVSQEEKHFLKSFLKVE